MAKNTKKYNQADLTLLKKLVAELESMLDSSEAYLHSENVDNNQYVLEMSKTGGVAAGIVQEATMLLGDIAQMVRASQQLPAKNDLESLLKSFKTPGFGN